MDYYSSAYVAVLEILFLPKIYKLRKAKIEEIIEEAKLLSKDFELDAKEHIEKSYLLFCSEDTRIKNLINILKFSLLLKKMVETNKNIFEFNILIFKSDTQAPAIEKKLYSYLLKTPTDNATWLFQEENLVIHNTVQTTAMEGGIQEVICLKQEENSAAGNFLENCQHDILFQSDSSEAVSKAISSPKIKTIGIVGKPGTGKTAFLRRLCQTEPKRMAYLTAHSTYQEASYPFVMLLEHLNKYLYKSLPEGQQKRLADLLKQVQLTNLLSFQQIKIDVCSLLAELQSPVILVCDDLDNWPVEAIQLLQDMLYALNNKDLKVICSLSGIYYPIALDEVVHLSEHRAQVQAQIQAQAQAQAQAQTQDQAEGASIVPQNACFTTKQRLLAMLPAQRTDASECTDFPSLLTKGLRPLELGILSAVQKFPYIFDRDILAQVFESQEIYELVDLLLDYHFLVEHEDHFGKHLFSSVTELPVDMAPKIHKNVAEYFQKETSHINISVIYSLLHQEICFLEDLELWLLRMLKQGFRSTVESFITLLGERKLAASMWILLCTKNKQELCDVREYFQEYSVDKDNIQFLLPITQYFYDIQDFDKALNTAKESIYLFNNEPRYKKYINDIFCLNGKIFIAKNMHKDAIEYINIGLESAQNNQKSEIFYQLVYSKLLCLFFERELHSVLELIEIYDFDEYLNLFGNLEGYLEIKLLIVRIYFEIGQYSIARQLLEELQKLAAYYHLEYFYRSISCWIARTLFYMGEYHLGFEHLEHIADCEEKLYFLSEGYYLYDDKKQALDIIMQARALSLEQVEQRQTLGLQGVVNMYSLQEGKILQLHGEKDPLLLKIQGFSAYLNTLYGDRGVAEKILKEICQRPSMEFNPFQHIFHYFYYLFLKKSSEDAGKVYLSYGISILQNESLKILNTSIKHNYIYNNYWNNLLAIEGEQHNLLILGSSRNH